MFTETLTSNTKKHTKVSNRLIASTGLFLLSLFLVLPAHATDLPNFKAVFDVEALGFTLGQAKQRFVCKDHNCTLTSDAKPSGLAAAFFKDSSHETVKLTQNDNQLNWLSYHKLGISYKDNKAKEKNLNLIYQPETGMINCPEKNRQWLMAGKTFDSVSIAYAIQHAVINKQPVNNFTLQDSNFQDTLMHENTDKQAYIDLEFSDDPLDAVKYTFSSQHVNIELWLLPKYNYFPGKIRIINKDEKTITLSLAEPPKLL